MNKTEKKTTKSFQNIIGKQLPIKFDNNKFRYTFYNNKHSNKTSSNGFSRLGTTHNSSFLKSNSFILESFYRNRSVKQLKYELRKKINLSLSKEKNKSSDVYKNFLREKMRKNISKLNTSNSMIGFKISTNSARPSESKKIKFPNLNVLIPKKTDKLSDELDLIEAVDNSHINRKNIYCFKNYILQKSLIKHFLYRKRINYSHIHIKDITKRKYIDKIVKAKKKSQRNDITKIIDYLLFLKEKIIVFNDEDSQLIIKREMLLKNLKTLIQNIKDKAESLCYCIKVRNLLICLKEQINLNNLPEIFTFFNQKKINNYTTDLENNLKLYDIDTNNFEVTNNLYDLFKNELNNNKNKNKNHCIKAKKCLKYLKQKEIFSDVDEFQERFKDFQLRIINDNQDYLINNKIINNYKKEKLLFYPDLTDQIVTLENRINELKKTNLDLQKRCSFYRSLIYDKNNTIKIRNIEDYDKEIAENKPLEVSRFYINFIRTHEIYNFKIEYAYVYLFISQVVDYLYKIFPSIFQNIYNFDMKRYKECIHSILNCDHYDERIIKMNSLYLLSIYETAIIHFLQMYTKTLSKVKDKNIIIILKRDIVTNKNYELIKFQKTLEFYINERKRKNIQKKASKVNLIKKNNLPNYTLITKCKENKKNKTIKNK